jgi:glycine/D-amino acid oxidase-like deaminating enzyme
LGDEFADTLRLWLEEGETATGALGEKIFSAGNPANPVRLKRTLEDALTKAGVRFLFSSYSTETLHDREGRVSGIVIANRAGRQAVIAKVVIDATAGAAVARQAGATVRTAPAGTVEFRRVVMSDQTEHAPGFVRSLRTSQGKVRYDEYSVKLEVPGLNFRARMEAENRLRDQTYIKGQLRSAGRVSMPPLESIVCRLGAAGWKGFEKADLAHFRPRGVDNLWVASAAADIPRQAGAAVERPSTAEAIGRRIGAEAAAEAARRATPRDVQRRATAGARPAAGDVRETLAGLRPLDQNLTSIPAGAHALPVLGSYDVVVIGGGTAGAAAAIGAVRRGAKVLVVEYQDALGGQSTLGLIGSPYHGRDAGFAHEVPYRNKSFTFEDKMEWYRREIRKGKGEIWFGVLGAGAYVEGNCVRGAVVATPDQRGVVLAKVVVDATGNSDVAISAGARYMFGANADDLALQGAGYPFWKPAAGGNNTDYLMVDESDMIDVWRTLVGARQTMDDATFDAGTLLQTRERRRIVGDLVFSYVDQMAGRRYSDSVVLGQAPYDDHGYPSEDIFALYPHDAESRKAKFPNPGGSGYTPYRALLPRGLDGVLVAGLGISMQRDAAEMVRMQRDINNQGYAAGVAAAMAAGTGRQPRNIDVRALQKHLVEIGSLPTDVLEHTDSFPRPAEEIESAVRRLPFPTAREETGRRLGLILSHREIALPMLRKAHAEAQDEPRLAYARVLGMLGERAVVPELAAALDPVTAWDERMLQGAMTEYSYQPTPVDTLILALGRTRDPRALPVLLRKLETLDDTVWLSHHRSLAAALESIGDRSAAAPLARLLEKSGMSGHASSGVVPLYREEPKRDRVRPLREISLARALYRCGDHNGMGERILRAYALDPRGVFARHAGEVLKTARK